MSKDISPNNREIIYARSTVTGLAEYVASTNHAINTTGGGGGGGSTTIADGVSSSILATVFDLTNSNPLAAQIVDASGNAITSFGGGTQYADGAARGTATGTLAMVDDGTLIQSAKGDTDGTLNNNTTKLAGTAIDTNSGNKSAGTQRMVLATDQPNLTTPLNVNVSQMAGTTPSSGNGATDSGTQRVTISNDSTGQIQITDGTNKANILKSDGTAAGQNSLLTSSSFMEKAALSTASVTNNDLQASLDVSNYAWFSIQITGTWTGTVTFQGSNDNSNFNSVSVRDVSSGSAFSTTTTSNGTFSAPTQFRYLRVRVTTGGTGTVTGVLELYGITRASMSNVIGQGGTWTVGSNSAVGSATPANAFFVGISNSGTLAALNALGSLADGSTATGSLPVGNFLYNGSNYDRSREVTNATNSTGTGITAAGILGQFDDTSPTSITENQFGNFRMSANRNLYGTIRDAAGNERGVNVTAGNALTVDASATTQPVSYATTGSGTATGALRVEVANNGTGVVGLNTGTNSIGKISDITTSVVPGTGATNLGKAEDAAHSSGDTGMFSLGVRNDTLADTTNTTGDYSQLSTDIKGRVMTAGAPRSLKGTAQVQLSATTSETTIIAATASTFHDVYGLILANTGASTTKVSIRDDTAGTVRAIIEVPTLETRGFMLPVDSAMPQTAVNKNWTAQCGTATTALEVTALYVSMV